MALLLIVHGPVRAGPGMAVAPTVVLQPQLLENALRLLALRTRQSIIFSPEIVRDKRIGGMQLSGSINQMLDVLLRGTALRHRQVGQRTIVIEIRPPSPSTRNGPLQPAGEIVVTALRRPTLLADTPVSLVVATAPDLERERATTLADLSTLAPSLYTGSSPNGVGRLSLRGVYGSGDPSIGLYYGEAPVSGPSGSSSDPSLMTPGLLLVDIERVEILRGPQGTLHGSGSLGGTIRVLFHPPELDRPSASAHAEIAVQKGGEPGGLASAMLNMPLSTDHLALRLVAYRQVRGGLTDNATLGIRDADRKTTDGFRAALRWEPSDKWRFDLTGALQHDRAGDTTYVQYGAAPDVSRHPVIAPYTSNFVLLNGRARGQVSGFRIDANLSYSRWTPHRVYDFTPFETDVRRDPQRCGNYYRLSGTRACTPAELDGWSAYVDANSPAILDQPLAVTTKSGELRVSHDSRVQDWTAGLFFGDRQDHGRSRSIVVDAATGQPRSDLAPLTDRYFQFSLHQFAAFAEMTGHVSRRVDVTVGGRYFAYSREASGAVIIASPFNLVPEQAGREVYHYGANGAVGRLRLDYRPGGTNLLYAEISTGFRPGGINIVPGLDPALVTYRDDRLTSYEIGTRWGGTDRMLQVDAALFHQYWSNMQYAATATSGNFLFVTNIGSAVMTGAEMGVTLRPVRSLSARFDATYVDARLSTDQTSDQGTTPGRRGDRLPFVPPFALGATVTQSWPLNDRMRITASLSGRFTSRFYSSFKRTDADDRAMGDTGRIDARTTIEFGVCKAAIFIDNLFDRRGILWASRAAFSDDVLFERPRTIGLSLDAKF